MVPENQWREAGMNMDKRTARKFFRDEFMKTIQHIRSQYLHQQQHQRRSEDVDMDAQRSALQVCVRKRPMLPHEHERKDFDVITAIDQQDVVIHECKMYSDMKHKFIMSHHHRFSRCFDETVDTESVYLETTKDLVLHAMMGNKAVCMMYGQTGSGKTYTMGGFFQHIAEDIFTEPVGDVDFTVSVSAIEIAGSKCYDLLNNQNSVSVCEDREGNITVLNATETSAESSNELYEVLQRVKDLRATETTAVNTQSSRSHLVCYVNLRARNSKALGDPNAGLYGQLALLDLAGSERNEDTFYHDAARTKESIEINKSHLALKQCMRALGSDDVRHVPYRASTLTRILKGCLWGQDCKGIVIATISPLSVDTEHTLYTLQCAGEMLPSKPLLKSEKREVEEDDELPFIPVKEWDNRMVLEWLCALRKGTFEKYACNFNFSVNGRLLMRFSLARFTQVCNGNATDASHLYKALRHELASQDKQHKERRARTIARHRKA